MPDSTSASPELAAAAKRITTLEADLANLRRGMAAQLTASGRLLQALQELDHIHFGGRFVAAAGSAPASPTRDVEVAEAVVAAAIQRLAEVAAPRLDDGVAAEVAARETELGLLRTQILAAQEERYRLLADCEARLAAAGEALQRESELRRADLAEARSIAAEVERIAAADPQAASAAPLAASLAALREAIAAGTVEGIGGATEQALVGWARVVNERAASAAQELSALRWQVNELEHRQRTQGESQRLRVQASGEEVAALREALAAAERERDRRGEEIVVLRAEHARLSESLGRLAGEGDSVRRRITELDLGATQARERFAAAEARVRELAPEVERLRAMVSESSGRANARERELAALTREHEAIRQQVAAAEAMRAELAALQATRAQEQAAAQRELAALRQQLAALEDERARLAERQMRGEEEARLAARRATEQREEQARLLREREQELGELRLGAEAARADAQRLRGELDRLQSSRRQSELEGADATRRAVAAVRELEDARDRSESLAAEVAEARRLAAEREDKIASERERADGLAARMEALERAQAAAARERRLAEEEQARHAAQQRAWMAQRAEMEGLLRTARSAVLEARTALQRDADARRGASPSP